MPNTTESKGLQPDQQGQKSTETLKVYNRSRVANDKLRGRKHITATELSTICNAIKGGSRHPVRDELMTRMCFTHGLRVSELVALQWQHVNLKNRQLRVSRLKNGIPTTHPIVSKREIMLLNQLYKVAGKPPNGYLFNTERNTPVSVNGFQRMFGTYSEKATGVKWNAHALRHGCGTNLVDQNLHLHTIKDYMGHRNIQNTQVYLHESAKRFNDIEWD